MEGNDDPEAAFFIDAVAALGAEHLEAGGQEHFLRLLGGQAGSFNQL